MFGGAGVTYGDTSTRFRPGGHDRGVQPVRSRHPDEPVPRCTSGCATRRPCTTTPRSGSTRCPASTTCSRPTSTPSRSCRAHGVTIEGYDQGNDVLISARRAQAQLAPQARVAAVHPARHRRPRAQGACHRGRGARRRTRPRRDRHRRRVLHPPADDGHRGDAGTPDARLATSCAATSDRILDRSEADERGNVTTDDRSRRWARSWSLLIRSSTTSRKHLGDDIASLLLTAPASPTTTATRSRSRTQQVAYRLLELTIAGHETTAKLIANGVVALDWYPDQRAELVADPSLIPNAVEEMLRWDPPSHYQGRWVERDVTLHGVTIPADSRVILITGAANHDERAFPDPEYFDIHREIERHVGLRVRHPPVHRRRARPARDAHRVRGAARALPELRARASRCGAPTRATCAGSPTSRSRSSPPRERAGARLASGRARRAARRPAPRRRRRAHARAR